MNCKPGDLAIIIGGYVEANIGKIVTVIRLVTPGQRLAPRVVYAGEREAWEVTGDLWTCDDDGVLLRPFGGTCCYREQFLKPLPGDLIDEEHHDEVPA